jgi:3-hydroxymyristoyl/3-hydroxydecanoyl-(acyl carrier protein) dehydratase
LARTVQSKDLADYLPHRGLNVLLDSIALFQADEQTAHGGALARGELAIAPGDQAGRDIFLRDSAAGGRVIMEQATAEILALGSLATLRDEFGSQGKGFFSSISNFRQTAPLPAGVPLTVDVFQTRRRAPFCGYRGAVSAAGRAAASCEILAFYAHPKLGTADIVAEAGEKKTSSVPVVTENKPVDAGRFRWKRPEMVFIHRRVHADPAARAATYAYTYPANHPHVPGHFPGAAVMMGIAQWCAAADALHDAAQDFGRAAAQVNGAADVVRADGTIVCEVKGLSLSYAAPGAPPDLAATKKIGFRDMVRPGEEIFIRVRMEG